MSGEKVANGPTTADWVRVRKFTEFSSSTMYGRASPVTGTHHTIRPRKCYGLKQNDENSPLCLQPLAAGGDHDETEIGMMQCNARRTLSSGKGVGLS
jgi:hypothetical protein